MMTTNNTSHNTPDSHSVASTSRSLLVRLKGNETEAWDRLITLYSPLVLHWCRKLELPEQDVADVIQEVFKSVASNINTFRKDRPTDTFRGWLRVITRSKVVDHFRRQSAQPKAVGGSAAQHRLAQIPEEPFDEDIEHGEIKDALFLRALNLIRDQFRPSTWEAFWQVVVDGQSPNDVAEKLKMRPGAVRVAKSRVLHRLRVELGELLE